MFHLKIVFFQIHETFSYEAEMRKTENIYFKFYPDLQASI